MLFMLFREHVASVFPILILFTALLHERLSVAPVTGFEFSAPTYPSWSHAIAGFLATGSAVMLSQLILLDSYYFPVLEELAEDEEWGSYDGNTIGSGLEQREEEVSEARLWLSPLRTSSWVADKNVGALPRWEGGFLVGRGFVAEVFAFSDAKELLAI
ncbi:hypothetical protein D9613_007425 [Agrocybe pediades]|uniref:Uncharacterized protein n=1 Tax=Agrocybe pediades TaxID=84607 RepID=A0A8H4QML1_9AGAR|nr:hypothetical protein D9613_007425 [Agrocybe pediades]